MKATKYLWIALLIIVIDQTSKLLVHRYMYIHEEVNVLGEWFKFITCSIRVWPLGSNGTTSLAN